MYYRYESVRPDRKLYINVKSVFFVFYLIQEKVKIEFLLGLIIAASVMTIYVSLLIQLLLLFMGY